MILFETTSQTPLNPNPKSNHAIVASGLIFKVEKKKFKF